MLSGIQMDGMKLDLYEVQLMKRRRLPKLVCVKTCEYEKKELILRNPKSIYRIAVDVLQMDVLAEEYVYAFCMDSSMQQVKGVFELSHGTVDYSLLSPRELMIRVLLCGASGVILVHNHPSGDISPSHQDIIQFGIFLIALLAYIERKRK